MVEVVAAVVGVVAAVVGAVAAVVGVVTAIAGVIAAVGVMGMMMRMVVIHEWAGRAEMRYWTIGTSEF